MPCYWLKTNYKFIYCYFNGICFKKVMEWMNGKIRLNNIDRTIIKKVGNI